MRKHKNKKNINKRKNKKIEWKIYVKPTKECKNNITF